MKRSSLLSEAGFSMIEVLVTLVILAFGLLGLAGMQSIGLKNSQGSLSRSQATVLGYDIIDRMRSNCMNALGGDYAIAIGSGIPSAGAAMSSVDLNQWKTALAENLASGDASIVVSAPTSAEPVPFATVIVQWNDSRSTGGTATQQVVVKGALPVLSTCQGV
jgi:type IV pilus assembly protein PilV